MTNTSIRVGSATALFASGFAALIYQSTWAQYLGLILGHSAYAQSLVLMLFMGGMAGGAAIVGRLVHRIERPILWYVVTELFLAVAGLSYHVLFTSGRSWMFEDLLPWLDSALAASSASWVFATATIILQTVALGATFPLIAQVAITQTGTGKGRIISTLYFANSIGAGLAAMANVTFVLPAFGLPGAMMTAGLLNALAALVIWFTFGGWQKIQRASAHPVEGHHVSRAPKSVTRPIYLAAGISGAASFVYEIVWVRILANALGSSIHVFELMLSAFILGIALGGYVIRKRIDQIADLTRAAGYVQLAMGVFAVGSCIGFAALFHSVPHFMDAMAETDSGYWWFSGLTSLFGFLVMLPVTICAGMVLPLLTTSLFNQGGGDRAIGNTYAANTLGSIFGVLIAVHFLMPRVGVENAVIAAACVDFILGLYLVGLFSRRVGPSRFQVVVSGSAALALMALIAVPALNQTVMSSGVYRSGNIPDPDDHEIIYYKDGPTASVATLYNERTQQVSIKTNGKPDASATPRERTPTIDESTMVLTGALGFGFSQDVSEVGVVGLGSGITSNTVLGDQQVERIDTIEIEKAMVEGAREFGERVERVYDDPRSNIVIDDARAYFASTRKEYDLIISEPSNPWVSGVANLFTQEFYDFTKGHLSREGLLVQWVQLYEISPELVASIFNALSSEFDDYVVYAANVTDMIVVASPNGKVGKPDFDINGEDFAFAREFGRINVESMADINARFVADKAMLEPLFERLNPEMNSDFFPLVSLAAPRARYKQEAATGVFALGRVGLPIFEYLSSPHDRVEYEGQLARTVGWRVPEQRERAYAVHNRLTGGREDHDFGLRWAAIQNLLRECPDTPAEEKPYVAAVNEVVELVGSELRSSYARELVTESGVFSCSLDNEPAKARYAILRAVALGRWFEVLEQTDWFAKQNMLGELSRRYINRAMFAAIASDQPMKGRQLRERYGHVRGIEEDYSLLDSMLRAHLLDRARAGAGAER